MELSETFADVVKNLQYLDRMRNSVSKSDVETYVDRIKRGTCFVAYQSGDNIAFAPSRFIGYRDNDFSQHDTNEGKDGKETTPALSLIFGIEPMARPDLESEYKKFCKSLGFDAWDKGTFGADHRYWVFGNLALPKNGSGSLSENATKHSYAVIVENDVTQWHDDVGVSYHFPKRYLRYLQPGTRLLHYKGRMNDPSFQPKRLSVEPHYFGASVAGNSRPDPNSKKGDMFVDILGFKPFRTALAYKWPNGRYVEIIPKARASNFWRDGVRPTTKEVFEKALTRKGISPEAMHTETQNEESLTSSKIEGGKTRVYSTRYERRPELRRQAVEIHGTHCFACESNLKDVYGDVADGFIHIHHKRPLYLTGETPVDPRTDLVPLCPTCHAIVHRRGQLLTVNQVRNFLGKPHIRLGD